MSEVNQEAVNQQQTVDPKQRAMYMKITKENNAVLKLEAEKWKLMFESLYYKDQVSRLEQALIQEQIANAPTSVGEPQQVQPTLQGDETNPSESQPIWETPEVESNSVLESAPVNPDDIDHVN